MRSTPAPGLERLWGVLTAAGQDGTTAKAASDLAEVSEPHARRALRRWADAGFIGRSGAETVARDDADLYRIQASSPPDPPYLSLDGTVGVRTAMSPSEFGAIRRRMGLTLVGIGRAIGRTGRQETVSRAMRRYESGQTDIREADAALIRALQAIKT